MKNISFTIDGQQVDINSIEDFPLSLSWELENGEDFQTKSSSTSFDNEIPATTNNDRISNTFHNPEIEDLTADNIYRRPRKLVISANYFDLLIGKAFLKSATHTNVPIAYVYDCYGDNADWSIDLKEATLYDFVKHITFPFLKAYIQSTYTFDGTDETKPVVFAPMKFGASMNVKDNDMAPEYMRPSLSVYFILFWAFKSLGYKIQSEFFNTNYFRRLIMPWTWGNFLFSEGTKQDNLKFLAKSANSYTFHDNLLADVDLGVTNDSTNGAYDENNVYTYNATTGEMRWTYLPAFDFGTIATTYRMVIDYNATCRAQSELSVEIHWYKNGVLDSSKTQPVVTLANVGGFGKSEKVGTFEALETFTVSATDYISAKVNVYTHRTDFLSSCNVNLNVTQFSYEYSRIILGGTISFDIYNSFKNYKFLDFFRGVTDTFNLQFKTDSVNKVVAIEPMHDYRLPGEAFTRSGYFNNTWLDWSSKQDLAKISTVTLEAEGEREQIFKFKDDSNDGMLKSVQDRTQISIAAAKYVLPDRFKAGKKEAVNRFFSPVMHYDVNQWKYITGIAPQMIVLVPENISNTSQAEAQNTFQPKLAWYKGIDYSMGWISDAVPVTGFPYAFAVNYRIGGENDPVLSYSNEAIWNGSTFNLGIGLLQKFYWQRLANMRNGQMYKTWIKINNLDFANPYHKEYKILRGQKWELIQITDYKPLTDDTTQINLRKSVPISQIEKDNTFPSESAVINNIITSNSFDQKYFSLKCLGTDIPKPK